MLHQANPPACSPEMECILDLQEKLLDFGCRHDAFLMDDLVAEFGQILADWLYENHVRVLDSLKAFMRLAPEPQKRQILEQFKHDRLFGLLTDDPSFKFALMKTDASQNYIKEISRWLIGFYNQLETSGFHPYVCGHKDSGFTKKTWWEGYRFANPGTSTCSVCDGSLNAGGESIDHFFPKSQYPALSIHPVNLLPLCKRCNNDVKKEKDPLATSTITEVFLPYRRYVRPEVTLSFSDNGQGGYAVCLTPKTDDPLSKKRVENFEYLFDISNRWSKALGEISEIAISRARQYIEVVQESGQPISPKTVPAYIDALCTKMERSWGKTHYEYLATEWLRWAKAHKPALLQSLANYS
jgi:hypothetical protein